MVTLFCVSQLWRCSAMKQGLKFAILGLVGASFAVPTTGAPLARTTDKAVQPFAKCFADTQDRAAMPWWFVPKANGGGTFSNAGAAGVRTPYFIDIADKGMRREVRLTSAGGDIVRAVDRCV